MNVADIVDRVGLRPLTVVPDSLLQQDVAHVAAVGTVDALAGLPPRAFVLLSAELAVGSAPERLADQLVRARVVGVVVDPGAATSVASFQTALLPVFATPAGVAAGELLVLVRQMAPLGRTMSSPFDPRRVTSLMDLQVPIADLVGELGTQNVWLLAAGRLLSATGEDITTDDVRGLVRSLGAATAPCTARFGNNAVAAFPILVGSPGPERVWLVVEAAAVVGVGVLSAVGAGIERLAEGLAALGAVRARRRVADAAIVRRLDRVDGELDDAAIPGFRRGGYAYVTVIQAGSVPAVTRQRLLDALEDLADLLGADRVVAGGTAEVVAVMCHAALDTEAFRGALEQTLLVVEPILAGSPTGLGTSSRVLLTPLDIVEALLDARQESMVDLEIRTGTPRWALQRPLSALLLGGAPDLARSLCTAILDPVLAYDQDRGTELKRTLTVFLATGGQWTTSAAELGIHVNTVRYRLDRIERLTGRSLSAMADRVDFYVALCIHLSVDPRPRT